MITGLAACGGAGNTRPSQAQDRAAVRGTLVKMERATETHASLAGPQPPAPKKPGDES
jgi:hypothetical protein